MTKTVEECKRTQERRQRRIPVSFIAEFCCDVPGNYNPGRIPLRGVELQQLGYQHDSERWGWETSETREAKSRRA